MAKLRTCLVCQGKYEYCGHCSGNKTSETWRNLYCSESCRTISHIYKDYKANKISVIDAQAELKAIDMPTTIADRMEETIEEIMTFTIEEKPKRRNRRKNEEVVETVIEEAVEEVVEETTDETVEIESSPIEEVEEIVIIEEPQVIDE